MNYKRLKKATTMPGIIVMPSDLARNRFINVPVMMANPTTPREILY